MQWFREIHINVGLCVAESPCIKSRGRIPRIPHQQLVRSFKTIDSGKRFRWGEFSEEFLARHDSFPGKSILKIIKIGSTYIYTDSFFARQTWPQWKFQPKDKYSGRTHSFWYFLRPADVSFLFPPCCTCVQTDSQTNRLKLMASLYRLKTRHMFQWTTQKSG